MKFFEELDRVTAAYRGSLSPICPVCNEIEHDVDCPHAATQENGRPIEPRGQGAAIAVETVAVPALAAQHARNRAYESLVAQMGEYLQVWDGNDIRAALYDAEAREEQAQAERDDEMAHR